MHRQQSERTQYAIQVSIPLEQESALDTYVGTQEGHAVVPLLSSSAEEVQTVAARLQHQLANADQAKITWSAQVQQHPEYPAINTGQFLALSIRLERLTAELCGELEETLEWIELDSAEAGALLNDLCRRLFGEETGLAAWLDQLEIEGESMGEALQRKLNTLPPATGWNSVVIPSGIHPLTLAKDPDQAAQLRRDVDVLLAGRRWQVWKAKRPRQRAVTRLAYLAMHAQPASLSWWCDQGNRNTVYRWWIDLAPEEAVMREQELSDAIHELESYLEADANAGALVASVLQAL